MLSRGWLLDSSVMLMLAPGRSAPNADLAGWLRENAGRLYLSAVTIPEIELGGSMGSRDKNPAMTVGMRNVRSGAEKAMSRIHP